MNIKRKYLKMIKHEINSPLTSAVEISRRLGEPDGTVLVITIKQENFIPFYNPMDIAPGEKI